jgi:hypothetical protein
MADKPKAKSSLGETELDKVEKQFKDFDDNVKDLVSARPFNKSGETEEKQTNLSQREISESKDIYLKPKKRIGCKEKFNDKYKAAWDFAKEYVHFTAENKEIIGETIDLWTRPFPGVPAEEWDIPVNTPVWGPRYLAEQIKRKYYHRLVMKDKTITAGDGMGQYYGSMAVDTTVQRLDCHPVSKTKSLFMGSKTFG